jgi:Putative zinc-finger
MTPDNSCVSIRPLLLEYTLGQLSATSSERVNRHLATCADCRAELEQWRTFGSLLAETASRIPTDQNAEDGWNRLHARLHAEPRVSAPPAHTQHKPGRVTLKRSTHLDLQAPSHREAENLSHTKGSRARPLLALLAAAALVALSVAIFVVFGGPAHFNSLGAHQGNATATPTTCAPDQYQIHIPAHATITSVAMVSAEEGWAVGTVWDPQGNTPPATLILHLQHCVWSPVGESIPSASLLSVSVGADGNGWAVGTTQKRDPLSLNNDGTGTRNDYLSDQLVVLHLAQGTWRRETIMAGQAVGNAKVQMVGSGGWMLLDTGKQTHLVGSNPVSTYSYTLLRYTGSQWSPISLSFKSPTVIVSDMSVVSAQEVWLSGYGTGVSDPSAIVARYSNGAWKTWEGNLGGVTFESLYHIVAQSGDDVSVSGTNYHETPGNDYLTLLVLHFDGTAWKLAAIPGNPNDPNGILYQTQPTGLAVTATGDVWSFSSTLFPSQTHAGYDMLTLHARAGAWQVVDPQLAPNVVFVSSLTMATATRGWAMANTYVQTDIGAVTEGHLVLVNGENWVTIPERQQ